MERPTKPFVSKCSHWLGVRTLSPRTQVVRCNNVPYIFIEIEDKISKSKAYNENGYSYSSRKN